jgi:hypothetical protein
MDIDPSVTGRRPSRRPRCAGFIVYLSAAEKEAVERGAARDSCGQFVRSTGARREASGRQLAERGRLIAAERSRACFP